MNNRNKMKSFIKALTSNKELDKSIKDIEYKDTFVCVEFKSSTIFCVNQLLKIETLAKDNDFSMSISAMSDYLELNFFVRARK